MYDSWFEMVMCAGKPETTNLQQPAALDQGDPPQAHARASCMPWWTRLYVDADTAVAAKGLVGLLTMATDGHAPPQLTYMHTI